MTPWTIIHKERIERKRLDSEFYSIERLDVLEKIKKFDTSSLGDFCLVTSGSTPVDRNDDLHEGIILLKTVNVQDGFINFSSEPYFIDEKIDSRMRSTRLQSCDILVNIVGATLDVIGRVAIISPNFPKSNITQAMALIRVNSEQKNFLPEFVFAFLLSKYGRVQISKLARPSGQFNLNHDEIRSILIPKIPIQQQKIFSKLVSEFFYAWETSVIKAKESETQLISKLGMSKWLPNDNLTYVKKFQDIKKTKRLDAEFFQPKFDDLVSQMSQQKIVTFNSFSKRDYGKSDIKNSEIYSYIEISDVDPSIGDVNFTLRKGSELPASAKIPVSGGELIISKVRPTRGAIGFVPLDIKNGICSNAFAVYKINSPLKEYLQVICRSIIGNLQFTKFAKGTSYPVIDDADVDNCIVPIISENDIRKISIVVQESQKARLDSKKILTKIQLEIENTLSN